PCRGQATLVAGLVDSGLSYSTDDLVALDVETGLVEPYWKPLSVKPGSWKALAHLRPPVDAGDAPDLEWLVSAADVGGGRLASRCPVGYVIFPRYEPGATTVLTAVSAAEA